METDAFRSSCQRLISEFRAADYAPAKQQIKFFVRDGGILELFEPHEVPLVQALGDQKQARAVKADGLQEFPALSNKNVQVALKQVLLHLLTHPE